MIKGILFLIYNIGISYYYFAYLTFYSLTSLPSIFSKKKDSSKIAKIFPHFFLQEHKIDVWIHAVSAGELKLAAELIKTLQNNENDKKNKSYGKKFLITYTSQTAKILSEKLFPSFSLAKNKNKKPPSNHSPIILLQETPLDFLPTLYWFIKKIQPKKFICIEHDVWPNTLWLLKKIKCSRTIVNFSLKPKDAFYYRRFPIVFKWVYDFDLFLLQNKTQADFLRKISLLKPFHYVGNLKFSPLTTKKTKPKSINCINSSNLHNANNSIINKSKKTNTIILSSSHGGEEKIILEALAETIRVKNSKQKKINLILIPRHLERLPAIVKEVENKNLAYKVIQTFAEINPKFPIHIVNSMGEVLNFYSLADLILIGDTFCPSQGGHNFIEALPYSAAVCYGEYQCNYSDITPELEKENACVRLKNAQLQKQILFYLNNPQERQKINREGKKAFNKLCYDKTELQEILGFK